MKIKPTHPNFKMPVKSTSAKIASLYIVGEKIGKWEIVGEPYVDGRTGTRVPCRCECGQVSNVRHQDIEDKISNSCFKCSIVKHGESGTAEYRAWSCMQRRCYDKKNASYKSYGARGIGVCNRWRGEGGLSNFLEDMGRKPDGKHSLERKNNQANYGPDNCKWATAKEQARNRRNTVMNVDTVKEIRRLYRAGHKIAEICRMLPKDYNYGTVRSITNGNNWKGIL